MSHNINSVNAQAPSRTSEISTSLNNLSDVSITSASSDQLLTWSGSGWANTTEFDAKSARQSNTAAIKPTSSVSIATPNPYIGATDPNRLFWEYAADKISTQSLLVSTLSSDTTLRVNTYGTTAWCVGFDIATTGVYSLRATLHIGVLSASSAYVDCSWTDLSYNKLGPITRFSTAGNQRNTMRGIFDATSGDSVGVYIDAVSGAYYLQSNYINIFVDVERVL